MSNLHLIRQPVIVAFVLIAVGCTSTSGTRVPLQKSTIDSIQMITVDVQKEEDFTVIKAREQKSHAGAMMFGLLGAAVEHAAAASSDRGFRNDVLPMLGDYPVDVIFEDKLKEILINSNRFAKVESFVNGKVSSSTSATLSIALKEWGLRPCVGGGTTEQLQVGLHIEGKLRKQDSEDPVWERDELYLSHECHRLKDYRTQENLLRNSLSRSVTDLAGKTANEILYP